MNPQLLISMIAKAKTTRYGLMFLSGVVFGGWLYDKYPEVFKAFLASPEVSLVAGIAGLWLSSLKTKDWEAKVDEALKMEPPKNDVQV